VKPQENDVQKKPNHLVATPTIAGNNLPHHKSNQLGSNEAIKYHTLLSQESPDSQQED
jgi:hypothetical protein